MKSGNGQLTRCTGETDSESSMRRSLSLEEIMTESSVCPTWSGVGGGGSESFDQKGKIRKGETEVTKEDRMTTMLLKYT